MYKLRLPCEWRQSAQNQQSERRQLSERHQTAQVSATADSAIVRRSRNHNQNCHQQSTAPIVERTGKEWHEVIDKEIGEGGYCTDDVQQVEPANLHPGEVAEGSTNVKVSSTRFRKLRRDLREAGHD